MALNQKILKILEEKTKGSPELLAFLLQLVEYESGSPGWYQKEYAKMLDKVCGGDN